MLKFALGNLLSRPLRSLLSLAGLAIAIAGMVALFAIAGGIERMVSRTFEQIPGMLVQQRGAPAPVFSALPAAWETRIQSLDGVGVVDAQIVSRINVLEDKAILAPPRFLVGLELGNRQKLQRDIYRDNLVEGRFLTPDDTGTTRCLVSRQIAQDFQKQLGQRIRVNRFDCEIVGIYETGSMMLDVNVLMEMGTVREISRVAPDTVTCFYVEAKPGADQRALKKRIEAEFTDQDMESWKRSSAANPGALLSLLWDRVQRVAADPGALGKASQEPEPVSVIEAPPQSAAGTDASSAGPVEARLAEDWSDRFKEFTGDLDLFLGLVTAIGVLIAVLSIVNTQLMSVTERTIEFGVLRANGWSQGQIVKLIALEAGLIGVTGGLCGALLGWGATQAVNWRWPDRLQLFAGPELLLFAVVFSTALGVLGGLYPAWIAARMSPMESIRRG